MAGTELVASINVGDLGMGEGLSDSAGWEQEMLVLTRDIRDALVEMARHSKQTSIFGAGGGAGSILGTIGKAIGSVASIAVVGAAAAVALQEVAKNIGGALGDQFAGGAVNTPKTDSVGNPFIGGGIIDITPTGPMGTRGLESSPTTSPGQFGMGGYENLTVKTEIMDELISQGTVWTGLSQDEVDINRDSLDVKTDTLDIQERINATIGAITSGVKESTNAQAGFNRELQETWETLLRVANAESMSRRGRASRASETSIRWDTNDGDTFAVFNTDASGGPTAFQIISK